MREDFDKYLANNKTYISDFDITKHIVLDNESNYWYSAEYVDKMLKKQDKEIERLNNIINKGIEAINVYQNEKTLSIGYQDLKRIRGILRGNEFDLKIFEEYLQELKGVDKE